MLCRAFAIWSFVLPVAVLSLPDPAKAEAVDIFFTAAPYACGNRKFAAEWRLHGDNTGSLSLDVFERRLDQRGANFNGRQWQLTASDLAAPLSLTGQSGRAEFLVSGLLNGTPVVQSLDRKGATVEGCAPTLERTTLASDRYAAVLVLLDNPTPSPQEASQISPAIEGLPPLAMLPELDQTVTRDSLQAKSKIFWANLFQTSLTVAANVDDATIVPGLEAALAGTTNRERIATYADLLGKVLAARRTALAQAGRDPLSFASSADQFCLRLGVMSNRYLWPEWFANVTGVDTAFWDEPFAQTYLKHATACKSDNGFPAEVTQRWPEIQKQKEGRAVLAADVDRISKMDLTLASVQAEQWLQLSREKVAEYNQRGISTKEAQAALETAYAARRAEAGMVLGAEMAMGGDAAPLEQLSQLCSDKLRDLKVNRYNPPPVVAQAFDACESQLVTVFENQAAQLIADAKAQVLAMDNTTESLLASDFFSIRSKLPPFAQATAGFRAAYDRQGQALKDAEAELAPKRQAAIDAAAAQIDAAFASADPTQNNGTAEGLCASINAVFSDKTASLQQVCAKNMAALNAKRSQIRCDQIWTSFEAPKGFREGTIRVPGMNSVMSVEKLVCSADFSRSDLQVVDNSGIFSSEYLLVREQTIGGTPVRFTAVMNPPEAAAGEWTLSEPKLNDTPLSAPAYKTSVDFMTCALQLEACFRIN